MDQELVQYLDQQFGGVNRRFEQVDRRFGQIDQRFGQIDQRFGQIDQRFGQIDQRFEQIDQRFGQIDQRFGQIDQCFGQIDQRFGQIDQCFGQIDQRFEGVDGQIKGLRQVMCEGFDEVKRHNGILIEDLRRQLQLVAEGFEIFVDGRYTQDQARIDERFRETHALIRSSYDHLNQRVENLERKPQG